jgi:hypothetical protein
MVDHRILLSMAHQAFSLVALAPLMATKVRVLSPLQIEAAAVTLRPVVD